MKELSSRHEEITGGEEEIFDTKIGEGEKEQPGGEQSSVGTKPIDWGQGGGRRGDGEQMICGYYHFWVKYRHRPNISI